MLKVCREYPKATDIPKFHYTDVHYDIDGWADASLYLPADYDLVYLKIKDKKTITGWVSGNTWEGFRLKDGDKVLYWKRMQDERTNAKRKKKCLQENISNT